MKLTFNHLIPVIDKADIEPQESLDNIVQIESNFSLLGLWGKTPTDLYSYLESCHNDVICPDGTTYPHFLKSLVKKYPWKLLGTEDTVAFLKSFHGIQYDLVRPYSLDVFTLSFKYILNYFTLKVCLCPGLFISICFLTTVLSKDLETAFSLFPDFMTGGEPYTGINHRKIIGFLNYIYKVQASGGSIYPVELAYLMHKNNNKGNSDKWDALDPDSPEVLRHRNLADSIMEDSHQVLEVQNWCNQINTVARSL